MARSRRPRDEGPLPPPLPPEVRPVGQLVAETIKLYGERFWRVLPLGVTFAALDQIALGQSREFAAGLLFLATPLLTVT